MFRRVGAFFRDLSGVNPAVVVGVCVAVLTILGLVVLSSAGQSLNASDAYMAFRKQLVWLAIALAAGAGAMFVDLEKLRRWAWPLFGLAVVLLILVKIPSIGREVNGARRWLDFGPMRLQPSEFAKLALVFALSHYLCFSQRWLKTFVRGFIVPLVITGAIAGLIILQPDFGTAALSGAVGFLLMFLAGTRLVFLVPTVLAGTVLFFTLVFFDPVRWQRITSFWDVEGNRAGTAYQLYQGLLAYGVGGVDGVGLGQGRQQMAFLPEAHTDFIFPIIGEELGMVCTLGIAAVFLILFLTVARQLRHAPNLFQFSLCAGSLLCIVLQAAINMGVVTGILPTKGMSLPFISYGGSNLVLMFILVGIILNCMRTWERPVRIRAREL